MDLVPVPEVLHHGVVRASVLAYQVDVIAGLSLDQDPDSWVFTTDLSLRARPVPAPEVVTARFTVLREGRRSSTSDVELTASDGAPIGAASIGFARVPRREGDAPKPTVTPSMAVELFEHLPFLEHPLREEAGVRVVAPGVAEMNVSPDVQNPAGTLQGAMVALLVEAAAEDHVAASTDADVVVTDLDIRFLDKATIGPVRSATRALGDGPFDPVEVRLTDIGTGRLTTLAYARAVAVGRRERAPIGGTLHLQSP